MALILVYFSPLFFPLQKYNIITFLPLVLYQQFRFFLNLYFLIMAISQFIPDVRIGYLYTYWGPLGFVLTVTICREAVDDIRRHQRDREVNSQKYRKCVGPDQPLQMVSSSKLKVRHVHFYLTNIAHAKHCQYMLIVKLL